MTKRICSGKTRPRQSIFLPLLILLFLSIPLFSHVADTFTVYLKDKDRYGRIVREVILPGGLSLNKELIHFGLAWWYRKYAPSDRTLKALEEGPVGGQECHTALRTATDATWPSQGKKLVRQDMFQDILWKS